jgi:hypothetical protein
MDNSRFFVVETEEEASSIADWYEKAMLKRSSYTCDLESHLGRGCGIVYRPYLMDSCLVGQWVEGVFVVSHFAPKNRKEGVALLIEAYASDVPFVVCVPSNLARQLQRLGFTHKGEIPQWFDNELVMKQVMVNRSTTDQHLLRLLNYYQP